jgi:hypothetical protein
LSDWPRDSLSHHDSQQVVLTSHRSDRNWTWRGGQGTPPSGFGYCITNMQGNPHDATTLYADCEAEAQDHRLVGRCPGLALRAGGLAAYVFVTSDFLRAQIENHAHAVAGRKAKIARISVDWGWTPHVHLDNVELSNADWGKAITCHQRPRASAAVRSASPEIRASTSMDTRPSRPVVRS